MYNTKVIRFQKVKITQKRHSNNSDPTQTSQPNRQHFNSLGHTVCHNNLMFLLTMQCVYMKQAIQTKRASHIYLAHLCTVPFSAMFVLHLCVCEFGAILKTTLDLARTHSSTSAAAITEKINFAKMFVIYSGGLCKVMHLYVWILLTYISGVGWIFNVLAYLCAFDQDSLVALSNEEYTVIKYDKPLLTAQDFAGETEHTVKCVSQTKQSKHTFSRTATALRTADDN